MPDREKVKKGLELCSKQRGGPELCEQCPYNNEPFPCGNALLLDALALLKEQEAMPSYNDAVDTIKFQSKVMSFACETLARYESEEPCNTLFYIKEQRQKCDERCCNYKTPDEWCWRRYLSLMAMEDSDD